MSHLPKLRLRIESNDLALGYRHPQRCPVSFRLAAYFSPNLLASSKWHTTASALIWPSRTRKSIAAGAPTDPGVGVFINKPPTLRVTKRRNNRLDHHNANKPTRLRLGRRAMSVAWKRKVFLGKGPYRTREPAGTFVEGTLMRQVLTRRGTVRQSSGENK